jgi:hypothetical protein
MKTILTLIFVLFIGVAAQAQNGVAEVKVETVGMSIVKEVSLKNEKSVARLYMFKNSMITKELSFTTKMNKAKLA